MVTSQHFVFTITAGRTGTSYLAQLLQTNLPAAEVHHERIDYDTMGLDSPDVSHLMAFNARGNGPAVQAFWRQKAERIKHSPADLYGETSHFNARAGLVENIHVFTDQGPVKLISLLRDRLQLVWSLYNRFDFFNRGFTWLFALDPGYPNVIVPSKDYLSSGMAGSALWYVDEMQARAAYYKLLVDDIAGVSLLSTTTAAMASDDGARKLLSFVTGSPIDGTITRPKPQNQSTKWHFEDAEKDKISALIETMDRDPKTLGEEFFNSGRRLSDPGKRRLRIQVTKPAAAAPDRRSLLAQARSSGQLETVIAISESLLLTSPEDHLLRAQFARDLNSLGRNDQALAEFDRLIREEPDNPRHLTAKGAVLSEMGQPEAALETSLAAARSDPVGWLNVSSIYRSQGKQHDARRALERCIEARPNNILARNALNMLLFDLGLTEAARVQGSKALELKHKTSLRAFPVLGKKLGLALGPSRAQPAKTNIIAFSLWGDDYMYAQGILENIKLAATVFPGWVCRVYHDASVPQIVLKQLQNNATELVSVAGTLANLHGGFWRFDVASDPSIDHFIIRDADGRLNDRDAAAVDAWLDSGKRFHIMRDHLFHTDLMLAGMWGGVAGCLPDLTATANALYGGRVSRWSDQLFLARVVWPLITEHCLIHDSFYHQTFKGLPFPEPPARTEQNYIGRGLKLEGWMTTVSVQTKQAKPNDPG